MTEVSDSWAVLETHGFPPEAVGWPARNIAGLLPEAIEAAISTLIRQREDLLAEVLQLGSPIQPQRMPDASETWAYIERLLHDECGLRLDEGITHQRANCINAIQNGLPDKAIIAAAVEFLTRGAGLHKVRVNGRMMDREAVAAALTRPECGKET